MEMQSSCLLRNFEIRRKHMVITQLMQVSRVHPWGQQSAPVGSVECAHGVSRVHPWGQLSAPVRSAECAREVSRVRPLLQEVRHKGLEICWRKVCCLLSVSPPRFGPNMLALCVQNRVEFSVRWGSSARTWPFRVGTSNCNFGKSLRSWLPVRCGFHERKQQKKKSTVEAGNALPATQHSVCPHPKMLDMT